MHGWCALAANLPTHPPAHLPLVYTAPMKNTSDIENLNVQGTMELARLERLASEAQSSAVQPVVQYTARGELRPRLGGEPQLWLHLTALVVLPLLCQRCLETVDVEISVDREFRFVATEAEAELEDEEAEEDILVNDADFDLHALIEDELIMALPMVPMHDECEPPVALKEEKVSPFAVLSQLKK